MVILQLQILFQFQYLQKYIQDDEFLQDLDDLDNGNFQNINYYYQFFFQIQESDLQIEEQESDSEDEQNNLQHFEKKQAIEEFKEIYHKINAKPISNLLNDSEFKKHIIKIEEFNKLDNTVPITVQDEEYHTIIKSNEYAAIIEREIQAVHKFTKDMFQKRFGELESIVLNPIDYVKCVKLIQNKQDLNKIDFNGILTNLQITTVTVAGSSQDGKPLSSQDLKQILAACDNVIELYEYSKKIQSYIESRMKWIAPNLSALVGSGCASRLITAAGGVEQLQRMPACNIQVMGSQKKSLLGMSKEGQGFNRGYFGQLDFVQKAPPQFQTRLVRMLSTNVAKAIRIDYLKTCLSGSAGNRLKEIMLQRFSKIQEPPPPKLNKPLKKPDDKPSRKRGGEKYRKMKQKLGLTDFRALRYRMKFGDEAEEEFRGSGKGFGMIGMGQVKINVNPNLLKKPDIGTKTENYFNKDTGFKTVVEQKQEKNILVFKKPI
ncbi:hypothetical protein IMG5_121230 [Ichthyophthirius multifiliis]|uniref:Nop domain-containing protein n=1 Tax=Ichthyophthirius multifiliis TaxID=5932 RepID=G0QV45_ICHMU|nr:hypothetical protein IMG5_121230 [Ichthyophthirius multifiliis]EGR30919.1 hypothetical protein IMG5_121230 [Ichthyophthirius multifiliis]|eukprot:XP_004032506.1 hypothetical protein IMG5_121230 [Ichthyophthirius multifiliis]